MRDVVVVGGRIAYVSVPAGIWLLVAAPAPLCGSVPVIGCSTCGCGC